MTPKPQKELEREKETVARAALRWVRSGMKVGLGSGSTASYFIEFLGKQVRAGEVQVEAAASSLASEALARQAGIPLIAPAPGLALDLTVDGADEITPDLNLIKGRGGAFLREKALVRAAAYFLVIADSSKRVERLGKCPVPVEVAPLALPGVTDQLKAMGAAPVLRVNQNSPEEPFLTDQQNPVLDCHFGLLESPENTAALLEKIPGIVAHGLFLGCAHAALLAEGSEAVLLTPAQQPRPFSQREPRA